jgi:hypothetical protein
LTVTVDVIADPLTTVTNTATVSGGGEVNTTNDTASDAATIAAFPGDANLDNQTDFTDLGILLANYDCRGDWTQGDFNNDGIVCCEDVGILLANYDQGVNVSGAGVPVAIAAASGAEHLTYAYGASDVATDSAGLAAESLAIAVNSPIARVEVASPVVAVTSINASTSEASPIVLAALTSPTARQTPTWNLPSHPTWDGLAKTPATIPWDDQIANPSPGRHAIELVQSSAARAESVRASFRRRMPSTTPP